MSTDEHYFIEKNDDGKFAVRAKGSERASGLFDTQAEAIAYAKKLNPSDHPDWSESTTPARAARISGAPLRRCSACPARCSARCPRAGLPGPSPYRPTRTDGASLAGAAQ